MIIYLEVRIEYENSESMSDRGEDGRGKLVCRPTRSKLRDFVGEKW